VPKKWFRCPAVTIGRRAPDSLLKELFQLYVGIVLLLWKLVPIVLQVGPWLWKRNLWHFTPSDSTESRTHILYARNTSQCILAAIPVGSATASEAVYAP